MANIYVKFMKDSKEISMPKILINAEVVPVDGFVKY